MSEQIYKDWPGSLTKEQAIGLLERMTDHDDPYWENIVQDYYDENSDTLPSIYDLFIALGITEQEYRNVTGADNINWPKRQ